MKIKLTEDFKFYKAGATYYLNDFTVLTGENGTGKSTFLEAIRHVEENSSKKIRLYHYSFFSSAAKSGSGKAVNVKIGTIINTYWLNYLRYREGESVEENYVASFKEIAEDNNVDIQELKVDHFKSIKTNWKQSLDINHLQFMKYSADYYNDWQV